MSLSSPDSEPLNYPDIDYTKMSRCITRGNAADLERNFDANFAKLAVADDCDGRLHFPGFAGSTEIAGRPNSKNQDGIYINPARRIIAGADGMGGHPLGEKAAAIALQSVHTGTSRLHHYRELAGAACECLLSSTLIPPHLRGSRESPGTTFGYAEMQHFQDEGWVTQIFTVGDYKAQLIDLSKRETIYLSKDQSLVQEEIDRGLLTEEEASRSLYKNVVLNSISACTGRLTKDPVLFEYMLKPGQKVAVVLYSDGISNFVAPSEICNLVTRFGDEADRHIIELAKRRITRDNVSVVMMMS